MTMSDEEIVALVEAQTARSKRESDDLRQQLEQVKKDAEAARQEADRRIEEAEKQTAAAVALAQRSSGATAAGTLPAGTPPVPTPIDKPINGGIAARSGKELSAFMGGGPPKPDWSGLVTAPGARPTTYLKFRPLNDTEYTNRRASVATKLSLKSPNLVKWVREIEERLQETGNDTYAEVLDPTDDSKTRTVSILRKHSLFADEQEVKKLMLPWLMLHDHYDKGNDADSIKMLTNSLDSQLQDRLRNLSPAAGAQECFPVVFYRAMQMIRSFSDIYATQLANEITAILPEHFPGQDIAALCDRVQEKADALIDMEEYRQETTGIVHTNLMKAGGVNDNQEYLLVKGQRRVSGAGCPT
jgi:hypothetical protein